MSTESIRVKQGVPSYAALMQGESNTRGLTLTACADKQEVLTAKTEDLSVSSLIPWHTA